MMRNRHKMLAHINLGFGVVTFFAGLWLLTMPSYRLLGLLCLGIAILELMAGMALLRRQ